MFRPVSLWQEEGWCVGRCGSGEVAESSTIRTPGTQTLPDLKL